ncbi:adenylate/guanylate cyclase domain-containing protein [Rubrivivax sp. RP6-9]|uniref:adenylate/guanylate cyclase domain-containing protein n=1 Tax=Rubrivivax sp. RP6-9 TaxID=3415750 RepID=UPI003CC6D595
MQAQAEALRAAIAALQAQHAVLGDALLDAALAPLRAQLAALPLHTLQTQPGPEQVVSMLCLDIVESTRLAADLEPEDVHALLDSALRRFSACVQDHGGQVLQFAGDSLRAAWDGSAHAARAVQAAQALLDLAAATPPVRVRVGVHSGPPADALQGAVAMEQSAAPGAVQLSRATRQWLGDAPALDAAPPLPD